MKIYIHFAFDYPLFLVKDYKLELMKNFEQFGLKNYNFSGFLSKKFFKAKDGYYLKNNGLLVLKTFNEKNLPEVVYKLSKSTFFGIIPKKVEVKPIEFFQEGILLGSVLGSEIDLNLLSEKIRKNAIEKYTNVYNQMPKKNSLIVIFQENQKIKLFGSQELIYLINVLGIFCKNGYEGFILDDKKYWGYSFEIESKI
ncbi:hypothetical protein [Thermosipho melanesiensis]|uniref:Uncharacterized protein n=1 Tax=Thermosipho melanesiensis (strain DSM 12029 / CIP 104789 / BI429) TaxID=391009 RepID=A6LNL7_THEM4|nr:hypothetical protein [Thermosipho melanesiensis]ABR31518.1 hypothetical protein Tmel_1675 [Thermosipho melanesiensis BI429]